jgi:hypothetical protein
VRERPATMSIDARKRFGVTADGKPISTNVYGFQPYFYLRLPSKLAKADLEGVLQGAGKRQIPADQVEMVFCDKKLLYGILCTQARHFLLSRYRSSQRPRGRR